MPYFWNAEISITLFLQGLGSWLVVPMRAFSYLGQADFFLLVLPALYWCVDAGLGFRIGTMLLLGTNLNSILKVMFHAPRPFWYSGDVKALGSEITFGFPSNHAQTSAGLWGLAAARFKKAWLWAAAVVVTLGVGVSRVTLGMHFTSDVVAGWLIGILLVVLFTLLDAPLTRWLERRTFWQLASLGAAVSLLMIGLQLGANRAVASVSFPLAWVMNARNASPHALPDPLEISTTLTVAGIWLGLSGGAAWLRARGGIDLSGSLEVRGARYLLGLVGIFILYLGLGAVLPRSPDLLGDVLRYLQSALIGAWVSAGAPLLFIRLGLAAARSSGETPLLVENLPAEG